MITRSFGILGVATAGVVGAFTAPSLVPSTVGGGGGGVVVVRTSGKTLRPPGRGRRHLLGWRDIDVLSTEDDGEGGEIETFGEIKGIDRDWTYDGYTANEGEIYLDVIGADSDQVNTKGAVFFMHGFSQYPVAYKETLQKLAADAGVVVFAVETGITSSVSRGPIFSNKQFWLQRAVSQDTRQLIEMMKRGEEPFDRIVDKDAPVGLCGHSMGGGLCFPVAADVPTIDYVFAMAPAYGVPEFDPIDAVKKRSAKNSLLLAGSWDLLASDDKVEALSSQSNDKGTSSSIFGKINRGLHTGFQDKLVLITLPLISLAFLLSLVVNVNTFAEYLIAKIISGIRTSTGQLDIAQNLMTFFFRQMVAGKSVTLDDAKQSLDVLPDKWDDKVEMSTPRP